MDKNIISRYFSKDDTAVIKSLAVILMFTHHLFAFPDRIKEGTTYISLFLINGVQIEYYIGEFGKICVAIFMVMSGYGTYLSIQKNKINITNIILKKIQKLYLTFWKVFIVFIPLGVYFGVERIKLNIVSMVYNFLAIKISYNGEWWFLTPFIMTQLLMPIIIKWVDRKNSQIFIDIFCIISLHIVIMSIIPIAAKANILNNFVKTIYWSILYSTLKLLPQFLMGCVIAKYDLFTKVIIKVKSRIVAYVISIAAIIVIFYLRKDINFSMDFIYAPIFIISSTVIMKNFTWIKLILVKMSKKSTEMWLIHSFYCYQFLQKIIFKPKVSILILLFLIIISYASAYMLDYLYIGIHKIYEILIINNKKD